MTDAAPLDIAWLRARLPVYGIGEVLLYDPAIPSTNERARRILYEGTPPGFIVLTDEQPAGRGRQGRSWISLPRQQVLLSVTLHFSYILPAVVMASAVATYAAVASCLPDGHILTVKWPNDIVLDGRKIAGILVETSNIRGGDLVAIVGIGINVNGSFAAWPEMAQRAGTVAALTGMEQRREDIILSLLVTLGEWHQRLEQGGEQAYAQLFQEWERLQYEMVGREVTVHQGDSVVTGAYAGVRWPDGALRVQDSEGSEYVVLWGDVLI